VTLFDLLEKGNGTFNEGLISDKTETVEVTFDQVKKVRKLNVSE